MRDPRSPDSLRVAAPSRNPAHLSAPGSTTCCGRYGELPEQDGGSAFTPRDVRGGEDLDPAVRPHGPSLQHLARRVCQLRPLRYRWRDGTSVLVFEPRDFMARLAAQVPPPRACSHDRRQAGRERRIAWSDLLRRVFAVDALRCDRCGSRMRVAAASRTPAAARFLLRSGEAERSPPGSPRGGSAEPRTAAGLRVGGGRDFTAAAHRFVHDRGRGSREPCFEPARSASIG